MEEVGGWRGLNIPYTNKAPSVARQNVNKLHRWGEVGYERGGVGAEIGVPRQSRDLIS